MKKLIFIFFLFGFVNGSTAQVDSNEMNLISEDLDLEMFEGKYTFYVDTLVRKNGISFYGITPFTSGFSFCFFIKNNSILEVKKFPSGMSKMPYQFDFFLSKNKNLFLKTYWYGDGTTSSSFVFYLLEVKEEAIDVIFSDIIFLQNKFENKEGNYNSFSISETMNNIIIQKKVNDPKQFININIDLDLNFPIPNIRKDISIKETFLKN